MTRALTLLQEMSERKIVPIFERIVILLEEVLGWSMWCAFGSRAKTARRPETRLTYKLLVAVLLDLRLITGLSVTSTSTYMKGTSRPRSNSVSS